MTKALGRLTRKTILQCQNWYCRGFLENSDEHSVTFRQESDGSHETYTLFFGFENPIDNLSQ